MEFKGITEWMATNLSDAESSEFSSEDDSAYHSELFSVEDKRPTEELDFEFGKPVSEILNFELSEKDKEMRAAEIELAKQTNRACILGHYGSMLHEIFNEIF